MLYEVITLWQARETYLPEHESCEPQARAWPRSAQSVTGTVIDVRIILKTALERTSSAMILCHNHPSGNLRPSDADQKITRKIKEAASLMDIAVLDHVIIAHDRYFSFADEGML